MISEPEPPPLADSPDEALRQQVEDLATWLILGDSDGEQWPAKLAGVCQVAEAAGRADVARLAAQTLEELSGAGAENREALFSANIARMQLALTQAPAEPAEVQPAPPPPAAPLSLGEDPEMIADFILESREHLTQVEIQMMTLEKDPDNAESINTVFRGFHTIKGLAGFLDLMDVREVAHETETLLDLARNQELRINSRIVDLVLAAADFLKVWLGRLEGALNGAEPTPPPEMRALLQRLRDGAAGNATSTETAPEVAPPPVRTTESPTPTHGSSAVKVETGKLDALVDLAGEMVIAQAMVRHHPELEQIQSQALQRSWAQLARITGELQKTAMSMRMVPVNGLFQKMNRLVRDLARKTGKQADLETGGADTELDRNVVEELADPLMHMVRNSMDHGLEPPEERVAAGKPAQGRVRLRASHQAGHIVIEVGDDGRGLVREKILAKAKRSGLVEDGVTLTDNEVFNFIFHPGFSTAAQVTDVSGRGVGMDVVRRQIEKLRGRIDIESTPGAGTSFFLRLPLTLAMIDGLVVGVGTERYVLPIFSVKEVFQPTEEMLFTIENRQEMAMVRDMLLPVVRLARRLGVEPVSELATKGVIVVAEAGDRRFCVLVDRLIGKQEVVIKSLGETMRDIPGVAGGAILGDGRVSLILDLERIFRTSAAAGGSA